MDSKLICVDCKNVFFGWSTFCNGSGVCNICNANRQANERFEKEMAQRRKEDRRSNRTYSDSPNLTVKENVESSILGILSVVVLAIVVLFFVSLGNSSKKEYSFYTPNDGSLSQSLKRGVVYNQYKCDKHRGLTDDPSSCVEIPKNQFERFCNEFDGINTVDNKQILDWNTGEISSLSRRVGFSSFYNSQTCHIEFSMNVDGKVKTGVARVITWTVNAAGKLVPYSNFGSTHWK